MVNIRMYGLCGVVGAGEVLYIGGFMTTRSGIKYAHFLDDAK